jgi:hypothetical protein
MKKVLMTTIAAAVAMAFVVPADASTAPKQKVSASIQAQCKEQAAKKFSAIHFMKRRNFTNRCMTQHANAAKAKPAAKSVAASPAAKPVTTGQAPTPSTTGQAPKQ